MLKVYLPCNTQQEIGGGFTFLTNLRNGLKGQVEFVNDWRACDIYFVAGVTLAPRDEVEEAKKAGKKIVFRVDNIPRKSRNKRSRVYENMARYGAVADAVVYQSKWAKEYAGYLVREKTESVIIYNGVDQKIFYPKVSNNRYRYLFVQYNRDENKRFPEAAYYFHQKWKEDKRSVLTIVGNFSPEMVAAGFDFFAGESIEYIPPINDQRGIASIYRENDVLLFPNFADAAPNTLIEARSCGLEIQLVNPIGGSIEMMDEGLDISLERMSAEYLTLFNSLIV